MECISYVKWIIFSWEWKHGQAASMSVTCMLDMVGGWKGEWFYSRIIPWSRRAEQTAGEGPVMRLPKVQVYNESFFMPNLCRERQARKAIRERQLSAIFPLQQYRISVCFHFIPLSLSRSRILSPFFTFLESPTVSFYLKAQHTHISEHFIVQILSN